MQGGDPNRNLPMPVPKIVVGGDPKINITVSKHLAGAGANSHVNASEVEWGCPKNNNPVVLQREVDKGDPQKEVLLGKP